MWLLLLAVAQSGVELLALLVVRDLLRGRLLLVRVLLADLLAVIVSAAHGHSPCSSHVSLRLSTVTNPWIYYIFPYIRFRTVTDPASHWIATAPPFG